jgi:hypothetical protein
MAEISGALHTVVFAFTWESCFEVCCVFPMKELLRVVGQVSVEAEGRRVILMEFSFMLVADDCDCWFVDGWRVQLAI